MECFNRINQDSSIPTWYALCVLEHYYCCFNRINQDKSIPTWYALCVLEHCYCCFNRINQDRSIPTLLLNEYDLADPRFQSYQSRQINPDGYITADEISLRNKFQSYQSKQINPDNWYHQLIFEATWRFNRINPNRSIPTMLGLYLMDMKLKCFNRINPNRSIPTVLDALREKKLGKGFQSYQSKQINPDDHDWQIVATCYEVSIVSIQTDQSRLLYH